MNKPLSKSPTITDKELQEAERHIGLITPSPDILEQALRDIKPPKGLLNHIRSCATSKSKHGYHGVVKLKDPYMRHRPWKAVIHYHSKTFYLGSYQKKEEAARAYDKAARKIWGDAAVTNFPKEQADE